MRKGRVVLASLAVVLAFAAVVPVHAEGPVTVTQRYPLPWAGSFFVPCANGGVGEEIQISGELNVMWHVTVWPDGRMLFKLHNDWPSQSLTAVGLTSGDTYDVHGTLDGTTLMGRTRRVETLTDRLQLVSRGSGQNYALSRLWHITVRPDGTVSVVVDRLLAECPAGS